MLLVFKVRIEDAFVWSYLLPALSLSVSFLSSLHQCQLSFACKRPIKCKARGIRKEKKASKETKKGANVRSLPNHYKACAGRWQQFSFPSQPLRTMRRRGRGRERVSGFVGKDSTFCFAYFNGNRRKQYWHSFLAFFLSCPHLSYEHKRFAFLCFILQEHRWLPPPIFLLPRLFLLVHTCRWRFAQAYVVYVLVALVKFRSLQHTDWGPHQCQNFCLYKGRKKRTFVYIFSPRWIFFPFRWRCRWRGEQG